MLYRLLLIMLLLFSLSAAASKDTITIFYNKDWKPIASKEQAVYYRKSWPENGKWLIRDFFMSGARQMVATSLDRDSEIFVGPYTIYHENGSVSVSGIYANGKREGNFKSYFANGKLEYDASYEAGEYNGKCVWYYEDGTLSLSGFYVKGKPRGNFKSFYENGKPDYDINYAAGELNGTCRWYYKKGQLASEEQYDDGDLVKAIFWSEDGKEHHEAKADEIEQMPAYDGDVYKMISKEVVYPKKARSKGIEGRVIIQFIVAEDGSIEGAFVSKSANKLLDEEALRVVQSMAKWKPGSSHNRPVKVSFSLPVTFKLD